MSRVTFPVIYVGVLGLMTLIGVITADIYVSAAAGVGAMIGGGLGFLVVARSFLFLGESTSYRLRR